MNKYSLSHDNRNKEETIIRTILNNNNYPQNTIQRISKPSEKNNIQKKKLTTFTYFGPEIRIITELFKNSEVGISYITKNNIKHLLRINENRNDRFNLSGVYQLQCAECPLKYIGQSGRTFKIRFKEHIKNINNNGQNSKFAQNVVDTTHEYGTTNQTMEILHIAKKGRALDTYERFHIYEISKKTYN
jgi:hypothetical protein